MPLPESLERIEKMRNGEKIKCPKCKDGYIEAIGDPKETSLFKCPCGVKMVLTKKH